LLGERGAETLHRHAAALVLRVGGRHLPRRHRVETSGFELRRHLAARPAAGGITGRARLGVSVVRHVWPVRRRRDLDDATTNPAARAPVPQ
jgi:hypothetical protein